MNWYQLNNIKFFTFFSHACDNLLFKSMSNCTWWSIFTAILPSHALLVLFTLFIELIFFSRNKTTYLAICSLIQSPVVFFLFIYGLNFEISLLSYFYSVCQIYLSTQITHVYWYFWILKILWSFYRVCCNMCEIWNTEWVVFWIEEMCYFMFLPLIIVKYNILWNSEIWYSLKSGLLFMKSDLHFGMNCVVGPWV